MSVGFNASGDNLRRTVNLPLNTAFSMMAWFYIAVDRDAFTAFLDYGNSGVSPDKTLQTSTDGTTLNLYDGTDSVTGTNLQVGRWFHLCLTYDVTGGVGAKAYLNGALDIQNTDTNAPGTSIRLGNDGSNEFLNGYAAAWKIWNAILTGPEIQQEMLYYTPVRLASLNSCYPLRNTSEIFSIAGQGASPALTINGTLDNVAYNPPILWAPPRKKFWMFDVPPAGGPTVAQEIPIFVEQLSGQLIGQVWQ